MVRRWLLAAVVASASASACTPARPEGNCLFWADCGAGGACEYTAAVEASEPRFECSFADAACPSGRRFGEFASAGRAEQCVDFAPNFGGICDDQHPCGAGVDCRLGRCNNVAQLDATGEAFVARCSTNQRAGGDLYPWGFVLGISGLPIPIGVFLDAAPLIATSAELDPPPETFDATEVSIGENHLCTVGTRTSDNVPFSLCIGDDTPPNPAVGVDPDAMPTVVGWVDNPFGLHTRISAGTRHTCGLVDASTAVDCWGDNADGQVDGTDNDAGYLEAKVTLPHRAEAIATGKNFTCAGTARGVYCWGGAEHWAPGTFEFSDGRVLPVTPIPASVVTAVAAGEGHACAIVDDQLYCFGANDKGQVTGEVSIAPQLPTQPLGTTAVISVSTGRLHTCAVTADHAVQCWGDNGVGQLGSTTTSHAPQVVTLDARAVGPIALADDATCVLLEDSLIHCFGTPELTTNYSPPLDRFALCLQ